MSVLNYVVVDKSAAGVLAQAQPLQTVEFQQGAALAAVLHGGDSSVFKLPDFHCSRHGDGLFMVGKSATGPLLVFDLEEAPIFATDKAADRLLLFQRLIRTAVKIWNNLRLSANERAISGSSKIVVFPFPISAQSMYRITIERSPDPKRGEKRYGGNHLLVFREGTDVGLGTKQVANVSNFRKAIQNYVTATSAAMTASTTSVEEPSAAFGTTTIVQNRGGPSFGNALDFNSWLPHLTSRQLDFVKDRSEGPARLEGPAGTGKTLCLVLKCVNTLLAAEREGAPHHAVFFAHSDATRNTIADLFNVIEPVPFSHRSSVDASTSVLVTTLQAWCADSLGERVITEAQFLDRDALDAKQLQQWYIEEIFDEAMKDDYETFRSFMSDEFAAYLETEDRSVVVDMLEHEIAVMVKGRAEEDLERYKALPTIKYGLPIRSEDDRGFVWLIYRKYSDRLIDAAQYDTNDIVLTALKQLQTPIWRRRRTREGYQSVFIDETHLFNLNELSVFHYLTDSHERVAISFSVDRSQAPGDRGLTSSMLTAAVVPEPKQHQSPPVSIRTLFRCSPDIAALAKCITAAGATLFTNFDDPLANAASAFTHEDESRSKPPRLLRAVNDEVMIRLAFDEAERLRKDLDTNRSEILVATLTDILFGQLRQYADERNKPVETLTRRGDSALQKAASARSRFILATADYVGGLEFDAVILVGIDDGRVPPTREVSSEESRHFQSFRAHNHLYVAVTRARYRLVLIAAEERGPSSLLATALEHGILSDGER